MRRFSLSGNAPVLCLFFCALGSEAGAQSWVQAPMFAPSPRPREQHAMAYDPQSDRTVLFGGESGGTVFADTWLWNGRQWTAAMSSGPVARTGHAMAAGRNGPVLFGGADASGVLLGDTWRWTASGWQQAIPGASPSPRRDHAMAATRDGVLLFGGRDAAGTVLADTWVWDGTQWTDVTPAASPPSRAGAAMAYDARRGRVVMFGGFGTGQPTELWEWDGSLWTVSPCACPRRSGALAYDVFSDHVVFFGDGVTAAWDGAIWRAISPAVDPGALTGHDFAIDPLGRLVLFGGRDNQGRLQGSTWLLFPPFIASTARFGAACGRPGLEPSLDPAPGELPYLGETQRLVLTLPAQNAPALGILGCSRTRFGSLSLPLDLGILGMPGCFARTSAEVVVPLAPAGSTVVWPIDVPPVPAAAGHTLFAQALVADPGANRRGLVVSNAVALVVASRPDRVEEGFDSERRMDRRRSSGQWSGGQGRFGRIGDSGEHGDFRPDLGRFVGFVQGKNTFEWNTDAIQLALPDVLPGTPLRVTDGRYRFSRMVVPADVRIVLRGAQPAEFSVSGEVAVLGELVLDGEDVPGGFHGAPLGSMGFHPGQPGGRGGAGGGDGGAGGVQCDGRGAQPIFHGQPGQDASGAMGTGGQGSTLFPADGLNTSVIAPPGYFFSFQSAAGGGGGGLLAPGGAGMAVSNSFNDPAFLGPPAPGGQAAPVFPIPPGALSSRHFLIGGAGGGGGGSHALFTNVFVKVWSAGAGGGGGGGALALRSGWRLVVDPAAGISARGGSAASYTGAASQGTPAPGGGGSGGSILLQADGAVAVLGSLDVRGGQGGEIDRGFPAGGSVVTRGGDGGDGVLRLEAPVQVLGSLAPAALLPGAIPPAGTDNVGVLRERDQAAAFVSDWFVLPPGAEPVRYELEVLVNGTPLVFSDDPAVGPAATPGVGAVGIAFQPADMDPVRGADPDTRLPWRTRVGGGPGGLAATGLRAFRFAVVANRGIGTTVVADRVTIVLR